MNVSLHNLISALLAAIPMSVGIRVVVCLMKMNTDPDQASMYKTRMKNAVIFSVVAESALSFLQLIYIYLK